MTNIQRYPVFFKGRSRNKYVFERSTSGGVVTELARYFGDLNKANGVVLVKRTRWGARRFIATSHLGVHLASTSQYAPVCNKIKLGPTDRVVWVDLPCQLNKYGNQTGVVFKIGLFCSLGAMSSDMTDLLIKKLGVKNPDLASIKYRAGVYPGAFEVRDMKTGLTSVIGKEDYKILHLLGAQRKCLWCDQFLNPNADISVGDYYLEKKCFVVAWNAKALKILKASNVKLEPSSLQEIKQVQRNAFDKRRMRFVWRFRKPLLLLIKVMPLWFLKTISRTARR